MSGLHFLLSAIVKPKEGKNSSALSLSLPHSYSSPPPSFALTLRLSIPFPTSFSIIPSPRPDSADSLVATSSSPGFGQGELLLSPFLWKCSVCFPFSFSFWPSDCWRLTFSQTKKRWWFHFLPVSNLTLHKISDFFPPPQTPFLCHTAIPFLSWAWAGEERKRGRLFRWNPAAFFFLFFSGPDWRTVAD